MEFWIKKNNTFPPLLMKIINNGKDDMGEMNRLLEKSTIEFTMIDDFTGIPLINKKRAFITRSNINNDITEYSVYYIFSPKETSKSGRFKGEFTLNSNEGKLILPLREELFINIHERIGK